MAGWSITSRAIDQASTTVITAATITDQFAPPRVPRIGPRPLAPEAERALHQKFNDLRAHGEWFKKRARLTRYIQKASKGLMVAI